MLLQLYIDVVDALPSMAVHDDLTEVWEVVLADFQNRSSEFRVIRDLLQLSDDVVHKLPAGVGTIDRHF